MSNLAHSGRPDSVTREIVLGKLLATVEEMAIVLARASMSPGVYEVLDFACGICDAEGRLIAQTNGITIFTGTFSTQVRFIRARFGDAMSSGDIFKTNDPLEGGGTHACDFAVTQPLFCGGGQVVAFDLRSRICLMSVARWQAACRPTPSRSSKKGCDYRAFA